MNDTIKPRVTAKDFFLWLGAMVALYVSTISLILLAHQYITVWFPDLVLEPYGTGASGAIRFSIAFLIVFFPLYVWLTRLLHQDLRANPEKKELWVRRWLVFLTLFVAGVAMAIDLVMLVNTFLNGELTMRFGLKALTILVVIGGGFWYYLNELRGTWEAKESQSKLVGAIVSVIVLVSVVGSFFIIGSPATERQYRIDDQRVNDLSNIQYQIVSYWQAKRTLPDTLDALKDPLMGVSVPIDPETGAAYVYRIQGALAFELCATFAKPNRMTSKQEISRPVPYGAIDDTWQHGEGEVCFTRTIDPDKYPPFQK
jgi:hypothetical protein